METYAAQNIVSIPRVPPNVAQESRARIAAMQSRLSSSKAAGPALEIPGWVCDGHAGCVL